MAGVLPARILVHTATPVSYAEPQTDPEEWIEGEPGPHGGGEPADGVPFACVLFLPAPGGEQQNAYRPKVVRTPTLLYNPTREISRVGLVADHTPIVVGNEDELLIDAPELAPWTGGVSPSRWLSVGQPQPFGPPGQVFGLLASVRQVSD